MVNDLLDVCSDLDSGDGGLKRPSPEMATSSPTLRTCRLRVNLLHAIALGNK